MNSNIRRRNYCFTDNADLAVPAELPEKLKYFIASIEKAPSTEKLHLQGFVVFCSPVTLKACKALRPHAHWEACKGNVQQNIDYCSKSDTHIDGPFELGERPQIQGSRNDIIQFKDAAKNGATHRDAIDNYTVSYARYSKLFDRTKLFFKPEPRDTEIKFIDAEFLINEEDYYSHPEGSKWFCSYDDHEIMYFSKLIDVPNQLLQSNTPFLAEAKYGHVWLNPRIVYIKKPMSLKSNLPTPEPSHNVERLLTILNKNR